MRKAILGAALAMSVIAAPAAYAGNIVETAQEAGIFNTLIAAASAAGLAGALSDGENLTVFAPTDEAFAALPAGTVETLLKPENKQQLIDILSYHVLPTKITSAELPAGTNDVATLKKGGDETVTVSVMGGKVMVDGATVISADVMADNGVIHVIDKVILPSD
ncbi:fasciclin domain-containing protein [uncultured Maritalea sp.]|uniref:fasciclin domain-containing protein n=1 Tax=uncultured Maritalea sp. TaxID=757249 RepID=UPI0026217CEA|nr:fasciclin domain-containing protein [uncultured Maritalea sp.]